MGSIVGGRRNLKADATINQNNNCLLTAFTFRSSLIIRKISPYYEHRFCINTFYARWNHHKSFEHRVAAPLTFWVPDIFQAWNQNFITKYQPSVAISKLNLALLLLNLIFSSCLLNQLWVDVCVHEGIVIDYWEPDLDQHHVRTGEAESQVSWFSRMLNQLWSRGDKIPLSSSLKGKELALNWGRQNINHTQRLLLSIHHTSLQKLKKLQKNYTCCHFFSIIRNILLFFFWIFVCCTQLGNATIIFNFLSRI